MAGLITESCQPSAPIDERLKVARVVILKGTVVLTVSSVMCKLLYTTVRNNPKPSLGCVPQPNDSVTFVALFKANCLNIH